MNLVLGKRIDTTRYFTPLTAGMGELDKQVERLTELKTNLAIRTAPLMISSLTFRDTVLVQNKNSAWNATLTHENTPQSHVLSAKIITDKSGFISIDGIDILQFSQAITELSLFRNRRFAFKAGDEATAAPFVYTIDGVKAGEPITPRRSSSQKFEAETGASLKEQVKAIIAAVFPSANGVVYDLDISYLAQTISVGQARPDGVPALPGRTVLPGVPIRRLAGLTHTGTEDSEIVDTINEWFVEQGIGLNARSAGDGRLRFAVTVYRNAGGLGGTSPVLRVDRIELPLRLLT
jgi:hypothetical protein